MEVIIQSLGFTASDNLETMVRERLDKMEALAHGVVRADVTFYAASAGNPEPCVCEIRLEMPGNDPFVKKNAASYEAAIDATTDALQNMLRRHKEKQVARDHHRGESADMIFNETES